MVAIELIALAIGIALFVLLAVISLRAQGRRGRKPRDDGAIAPLDDPLDL